MARILDQGLVINETYKVEFFVGEGAFGEVYRVKHKFFSDFQVMKVFKTAYSENTDLQEIVNEAQILAKLTHPNIVRVFEVNQFYHNGSKHHFMTMSFVSGESLSQLLRRKMVLDVQTACSIVTDVLQGLEVAHQHSPTIIHRDINPDNILLSYDGPKPMGLLGDFGIARSQNQIDKLVGAGGRYLYFAPECFWDCYLPASDIFSLGIVFYKLLTAMSPWDYDFTGIGADDTMKIKTAINSGRKRSPFPPSKYNPDIDTDLEAIILKSIEKDMEKRYRTASEFLKDLIKKNNVDDLSLQYWVDQNLISTP